MVCYTTQAGGALEDAKDESFPEPCQMDGENTFSQQDSRDADRKPRLTDEEEIFEKNVSAVFLVDADDMPESVQVPRGACRQRARILALGSQP